MQKGSECIIAKRTVAACASAQQLERFGTGLLTSGGFTRLLSGRRPADGSDGGRALHVAFKGRKLAGRLSALGLNRCFHNRGKASHLPPVPRERAYLA